MKIIPVLSGICGLLLVNCAAWRTTAADDYTQGKTALRLGNYGKAKQYFESALRSKSNIEESRGALIRTLRETGAYGEALQQAEEFLGGKNNSAVVHLEHGLTLIETGSYASAEKHLRDSIALTRAGSLIRMQATIALGELLEYLGRKNDARPLWDEILQQYRSGSVQGSQALGSVAVAAWHSGYEQDARDIFVDATDPKLGEVSPEVATDFGYLLLEKYNARDAIGVFRDCLKINKSYPRALIGIALAKKYDGDFEVEAYSRAALNVNPNFADAWNTLAQLAIEAEEYGAALRAIEMALGVNPANLDSLSLMGFCRYIRGDRAGFADIEKRVFEINPSCGKFYHILAENLVSRRKYQEAVDWSRKAVDLDPELWAAHLTLGMNLTRVGYLEEGRREIQRAFDGDQYNVWAINSLDLFDQMEKFVRSRSEHFIFLMDKEDKPALSSYAPQLAEEVYKKLTLKYGFKPNGPLQIEIFPDHEGFAVRTLGLMGLSGALGVCFGKVVAIDSPRARDEGSFNWGSTLWHEFAHVMTLQMSNYNIPRWYSEGLSVYEEHHARPGWGDGLTTAFLRAYQAGKLMKASELNEGFVRPKSPEQIMFAYYQAGLVCEMIEQLYGFDKIRQSLLLFAENMPTEEVFRQTLGLSTAQMDAAYEKFIDARFKDIASRVKFTSTEPGRGAGIADAPTKSDLLKQIEANPDEFWANLQLGSLLRKEGVIAEAELHLKKAQQAFPQYVGPGNPYEQLGQMYLDLKRDEEALDQFRKWSTMDDNARDPLLKAAEIYRNRKDWASAVETLTLSVFINPYDTGVQNKLGEAAMECGKWDAAIAAYRTLTGLNVPNIAADAHYDLSRALLASGNREEARREVLRSLEIAPTYRKAQELLLKLSGEKQ